MIEFNEAIDVARDNVRKLVEGARDIRLESAMISAKGDLYEITFSYEFEEKKDLQGLSQPSIATLARLMSKKRELKVFLVDSENGRFRGFRNYKE